MSDYSLEKVCKLVSVAPGRLHYWQRIGLFPRRSEGYDWADLQRARLLERLTAHEGVPATRLMRHEPLLEGNNLYGYGRALVVDQEDGPREVESGQFLLEFQADPGSAATVYHLPEAIGWEEHARTALESGDADRAMDLACDAVEADCAGVAALNNLGLAFLDRGQTEYAINALTMACSDPDAGARQWFNLAHAMDAVEDPEAAVEALEQALLLDPDFSAARFNLAHTCEALGQTGKAYRHWRAFLQRHPDSDDADRIRKHLLGAYDDGRVVPLRLGATDR